MSLPPVTTDPISEFRVPGIKVRVLRLITGRDPVQFPPVDKLLRPVGAVDGHGSLSVSWEGKDGRYYEAVVLVESK